MTKNKKSKKDPLAIKTYNDKVKIEIAEELGLIEKIKERGWGDLSASETGRIGGLMTKRLRESQGEN
ncbi:hypothetical protein GGQ84_001741 [Desulfitispora alkaliphila]|uniref:small, acid-soluble spore protein, alpha/beta type n=1 Tax=Desulfitispora alkaliphila TaxID=622674 RepID=UPI003D25E88C